MRWSSPPDLAAKYGRSRLHFLNFSARVVPKGSFQKPTIISRTQMVPYGTPLVAAADGPSLSPAAAPDAGAPPGEE